MATFKYAAGAQLIGTAGLNLLTANVGAMLVSAAYVPNPILHQHVADIPSGAQLIRSGLLTQLALTRGVFSGVIPEMDSFINVNNVSALVLYVETGNDALSTLLYYSSDGPGFPFLPAGLNYFVGYDQANGGFFQV